MVAGDVTADPALFLNRARSSHPFSNSVSLPVVNVVVLSVLIVIHDDPFSTDSCHTTRGVGRPLAAAEKVKVPPE